MKNGNRQSTTWGCRGQSIVEYLVVTAAIIGAWMALADPAPTGALTSAFRNLMTAMVDQVPADEVPVP